MKSRKAIWKKLRDRYKLTILNESTYEEVMHMRLSRLRVFAVLSTVAVVLITLTIMLIAFTSLREFIPGYPDRNLRRQITMNALRLDSLTHELERKDRFFNSIRMIVAGENPQEEVPLPADSIQSLIAPYDSLALGASENEAGFREVIEERERFNLSIGELTSSSSDFYHFFPPLAGGAVTNRFDEKIRHYGVDLVAKPNSNVSAVLDGVVIFSDWTMKTGYVIQIQHAGDFVSIYKHNSVLLKKQGDFVRVGEVIAVVGNTGEETTGPHLHFELWRGGKSVDPEKYIKFD